MHVPKNRVTRYWKIEHEPYEPASEEEDLLDDSERRATIAIIHLQLRFKEFERKTIQNIDAWEKAIKANNPHVSDEQVENTAALSAHHKIQKAHEALTYEIHRILHERQQRDSEIKSYVSMKHE